MDESSVRFVEQVQLSVDRIYIYIYVCVCVCVCIEGGNPTYQTHKLYDINV